MRNQKRDSNDMQSSINKTGHGRPRTRRDFLATGLQGFAAMSMAPTLPVLARNLILGRSLPMDLGLMPFLTFDLAGGAALPANVLVGGQGGPEDLLPSYDLLGWDPRASDSLDAQFGLPFSKTYSGLRAGILSTASTNACANLRFASICHTAQDDSSSNALNACVFAAQAGLRGTLVQSGLGTVASNSGGNSAPGVVDVTLRPTQIKSAIDLVAATSFEGRQYQGLSRSAIEGMADAMLRSSKEQTLSLASKENYERFSQIVTANYTRNRELVGGTPGVDPRLDPVTAGVYGLNAATAPNEPSAVEAAIVSCTLKGMSGPSTWTLGGYDYHDGTSETGDRKDTQAGNAIGRAVELAHQLGRPLYFQIVTDGGCAASKGTRKWTSDSGVRCLTLLGCYDPAGPKNYQRPNMQLGYYSSGQGVNTSPSFSASPARVAQIVFLNYLSICNRMNLLEEVLPQAFTPTEIEEYLLFAV